MSFDLMIVVVAVYYFLPAFVSNLMPPLMQWLPFLNVSINRKLFGANKTIRGFVFACIFGTLMFVLQKSLYQYTWFQSISLIDYSTASIWLGFLLAFGAITGDLIESFFKRRMKIKPGKPWMPFDQIDFVVGGLIFSSIIFIPELKMILLILLSAAVITMSFHYIGYFLGINKDKI